MIIIVVAWKGAPAYYDPMLGQEDPVEQTAASPASIVGCEDPGSCFGLTFRTAPKQTRLITANRRYDRHQLQGCTFEGSDGLPG